MLDGNPASSIRQPVIQLCSMKNDIFQALADAARRGESVALGIITGAKGSSPQKIGAKAIFHADRRIEGTLRSNQCAMAKRERLI
jgi:xanthine/CO dehydrogenase XdhC/CoxF family maturation factor